MYLYRKRIGGLSQAEVHEIRMEMKSRTGSDYSGKRNDSGFRLEMDVEPLFVSMALYDSRERKKVWLETNSWYCLPNVRRDFMLYLHSCSCEEGNCV